jgi:carnitine O-acetyltransferase
VIKASESGKKSPGSMTPFDDSIAASDDEGLGGCKNFSTWVEEFG